MKQVLNPSFASYNDSLSRAKGNVVRTKASRVLHKRMSSTTENLVVISGIPNTGHWNLATTQRRGNYRSIATKRISNPLASDIDLPFKYSRSGDLTNVKRRNPAACGRSPASSATISRNRTSDDDDTSITKRRAKIVIDFPDV